MSFNIWLDIVKMLIPIAISVIGWIFESRRAKKGDAALQKQLDSLKKQADELERLANAANKTRWSLKCSFKHMYVLKNDSPFTLFNVKVDVPDAASFEPFSAESIGSMSEVSFFIYCGPTRDCVITWDELVDNVSKSCSLTLQIPNALR
ncbi:hypothetical protein [Gardnerella vaginalis]|uniref:hypothetical protein n=1 Tax=Gardnerella vaginalis TaxID=2702 RepID=UPI000943860A|nr:hypothetical protein [Gardnerella vaginalis]AYZ21683.1 hypothetical protein EGX90_03855 [Gardnerella vaginalis]OKY55720.1 hypothetical protein BHS10_00473 [Gardnerella vaginalis]PNL25809.1 hypothetical protein CEP75_003840 [Gardnerella vaginalis]PTE04426.1 hypothetical protein C6Y65_00370 [Gardnerella vaginalis]